MKLYLSDLQSTSSRSRSRSYFWRAVAGVGAEKIERLRNTDFNIPTASSYRNQHNLCGVFKNYIRGFFGAELLFWFGLDYTLLKLRRILCPFCHFRKSAATARKKAFCPSTHFLNKIWRPNEYKFYEGSGLVTPSTPHPPFRPGIGLR